MRLDDGALLAFLRTRPSDSSMTGYAFITRSSNEGRSWTKPTNSGILASSHHLLPLRDGRILLAYGDLSGLFAPGRPTVGRLLWVTHKDFYASVPHFLYAAGYPVTNYDQAYPSSAEVPPGELLTVSYDTYRHEIVGVSSRFDDYDGSD